MDRVLKTHVQGSKSVSVPTGAALYAHHYTGKVHYAGGNFGDSLYKMTHVKKRFAFANMSKS